MTRNARPAIVAAGFWLYAHRDRCTYSEGAQRMSAIGRPFTLPYVSDCSAFVTVCYNWAGAPDPNHLDYDHEGYTGTLLSAGEHIALWRVMGEHKRVEEVEPGDVLVLGPGTGVHAALVVSPGPGDPICLSMGKPGDPSVVRSSALANALGQPTWLRFNTQAKKLRWPPDHKKA